MHATEHRVGINKDVEEALAAYAEDFSERGLGLPAPHHVAGTVVA